MPQSAPLVNTPRSTLLIAGLALWALMAYWSFCLVLPPEGTPPWIFIDNLNLLIHEAGHWLWLPFGQFMSILGGSLTQILMPAMFIGYFVWKKDWFGTSFSAFWLGDNLVNVSYYVADARAMSLPLLGGDTSGHDWHNILSALNMLEIDAALGQIIRIGGYLALLIALVLLVTVLLALWLERSHSTSQPASGAAQYVPNTAGSVMDEKRVCNSAGRSH
jgi:hypothetical protein